MDIPQCSFITMEPWAGKVMAQRWQADLLAAFDEVTAQYLFKDECFHSSQIDYSIVARMAKCKSKAEMAIELALTNTSLFDSFLYEVSNTYREYFRDTFRPDGLLDDPDVNSIREILAEFYKVHPEVSILTIVPLDWTGTFGFVVIPKDMNP